MSYTHPEALVSTEWLAEHLTDPRIKVVDASYDVPGGTDPARKRYEEAHIPGAVFFDINEIAEVDVPQPHTMPQNRTFEEKVGALGISNLLEVEGMDDPNAVINPEDAQHHVVVYDSMGGACAAARVWFMFRSFGHTKVSVLDGGLGKWKAEDRPLTKDKTEVTTAPFYAMFKPEFVRYMGDVLMASMNDEALVIDARAAARFRGEADEPREGLAKGHIPNSANVPFLTLYDKETMTLKDAEGIEAAFHAGGVDFSKPLISSCGSGVTACVLSFGAYLIGKPMVPIYDGSWSEWGASAETPKDTGPSKAQPIEGSPE